MSKDYRSFFSQIGIKHTNHRSDILDLLYHQEKPLSAEELFITMKERDDSINLSTVYRTLDLFAEKGVVSKSTLWDDGKIRYEINRQAHQHHMVCLGCHKVMQLEEDECPLEDLEKALKKRTGFEVTEHKLELYGYCPDCSKMKH